MLETVSVGHRHLAAYEECCGGEVVEQLRQVAAPLRGVRVLHLNATPYGGGVAEILRSEVPLLRDLGIRADWKLITGGEAFFRSTKAMHNGLQGAPRGLTQKDRSVYLEYSRRNGQLLEQDYDIYVIHDPQPLGIRAFRDDARGTWIWRCHIDTSSPNAEVWEFIRPFLQGFNAAVYTLGGFVPPDVPIARVEIIPPAIDPVSPKNMVIPPEVARSVLEWIGVDLERPLVVQVSRFDPWKDPLGVIRAYRLAREEIPDLLLALVGSMALDDPEGWEIHWKIRDEARDDEGIRVFTNLTGVSNVEVNAFQRMADVVMQLSIREGFGLVVSETLWKGTPVVARAAGGIPLQMQGGSGVLVETAEECARAVVGLVRNREEARELGRRGRELVRERFLLTRLIADELKLYASLLGVRVPAAAASVVGLAGEVRDPVCGMAVSAATALEARHQEQSYYFCSGECRREFLKDPPRFLRGAPLGA